MAESREKSEDGRVQKEEWIWQWPVRRVKLAEFSERRDDGRVIRRVETAVFSEKSQE